MYDSFNLCPYSRKRSTKTLFRNLLVKSYMPKSLQLFVIVSSEIKTLGFPFNYAKLSTSLARPDILNFNSVSSRVLKLSMTIPDDSTIDLLKFSNSGSVIWTDEWIDPELNVPVDPGIAEMNLTNSEYLESVNILGKRDSLKKLDLSGSRNLKHLSVSNGSSLKTLFLNNCDSLQAISLGYSRNLKYVSLSGCRLSEITLEQFLRTYYPVQNGVNLETYGRKRIQYDSYLDLRGNIIPWTNRRIASKIRLLLCNAVAVLWSNDPPENVIPIELYRSFNI